MGDDAPHPPPGRGWWQASDGLWYPPPAPPPPPAGPAPPDRSAALPDPVINPSVPVGDDPPGCAQLPWLIIKFLLLAALLVMIVAFVVAVVTM